MQEFLAPLTRYAKFLVKGKPWLDHRDLVNDTVVSILKANPEKLCNTYVIKTCYTNFLNSIKRNPLMFELRDDYSFTYIEPYDTDKMYEQELLYQWAERVLSQRCPYGRNTIKKDRERRIRYLKEYRKRKKNEAQRFSV